MAIDFYVNLFDRELWVVRPGDVRAKARNRFPIRLRSGRRCGNDRKRGKGKGKGKADSLQEMTAREAKATATAKTEADSLRE